MRRFINTVVNGEFAVPVVRETDSIRQFEIETKVYKLNEKPPFFEMCWEITI
jgi:hypothetical protein